MFSSSEDSTILWKIFFLLGRVLIEGFRAKSAYIAFRADLYVCRTDLRNHMDKKTSGKCHASVTSSFSKTTVSFVFHSTKDLQEIPLSNWVFLHTLFLENEVQINKTNYATILFMSKQVCMPKISARSCKNKNRP